MVTVACWCNARLVWDLQESDADWRCERCRGGGRHNRDAAAGILMNGDEKKDVAEVLDDAKSWGEMSVKAINPKQTEIRRNKMPSWRAGVSRPGWQLAGRWQCLFFLSLLLVAAR